jgi:hypothetical protein
LGFERIAILDIQMAPDVALESCHMRCRI